MNKLNARIKSIQQADDLAFIDLDVGEGDVCSCLVILSDLESEQYRPGREVSMVFKESAVAVAKGFISNISMRNQFRVRISRMKQGEILTQVFMDYRGTEISAFISARSANDMHLCEGDSVTALVKASETVLAWGGEE